jgi:hypothetical protein
MCYIETKLNSLNNIFSYLKILSQRYLLAQTSVLRGTYYVNIS